MKKINDRWMFTHTHTHTNNTMRTLKSETMYTHLLFLEMRASLIIIYNIITIYLTMQLTDCESLSHSL